MWVDSLFYKSIYWRVCNDCSNISLQHSTCSGYLFRTKEIFPWPYLHSGIFSIISLSFPSTEVELTIRSSFNNYDMSGYGNDTVAGGTRSHMGTKRPLMLLKGKESGKRDTQPWSCLFALKLLSQYDLKHLCVIGLQSKADFVLAMNAVFLLSSA